MVHPRKLSVGVEGGHRAVASIGLYTSVDIRRWRQAVYLNNVDASLI